MSDDEVLTCMASISRRASPADLAVWEERHCMSRVLRYGEDLWESQREPRCSFICAQAFSTLTAIHQPVRMIPSDKLTSCYTTLTSRPPAPPPPHLPSRAEPKQPVDSRNRFPNPLRMNPTKYEYLLDPTETKTFERPSEKRCRA